MQWTYQRARNQNYQMKYSYYDILSIVYLAIEYIKHSSLMLGVINIFKKTNSDIYLSIEMFF